MKTRSNYHGVCRIRDLSGRYKWSATKTVKGKSFYYGRYPYTDEGERAAALAYDKQCIKMGIYDNLNILKKKQ